MSQAERDIRRKRAALEHAVRSKNVSRTCRFFGISRDTFYEWRRAYERAGTAGLVNRKRGPKYPERRQVPAAVQAQILELRRTFSFGPQRIVWYLSRYHGVRVSTTGVWRTLKRHGVNRLPRNTPVRSLASWRRYEKRVPGHHVQIDVKFVDLVRPDGGQVRRFQYTAIDDATRIRALRVYPSHT
jgi:transposase-like protein